MIISVTGTPGTGKTKVSKDLAERLGYSYVDVNEVARSEEVNAEEDYKRGALSVDIKSLVKKLKAVVDDDSVLDGHLSHYFPADIVVVLRCNPSELGKRLKKRGWARDKIEENLEAEALDAILQQAVAENEDVVELDTSSRTAEETSEIVAEILKNEGEAKNYRPGNTEWNLNNTMRKL